MVLTRRTATSSLLAVALLLGTQVLAPPAGAATYSVPCGAAWLVAGIEQANGNPGGDTLNLSAGCTYTFNVRYGETEYALPSIQGGLTINGNGAIIERGAEAPSMGVASVPGDLIVSNTTLREFWGFNGAYFAVSGSLVLVDSLITNVPPTGQQDAAIQVTPAGTLAVVSSTIENQFDLDSGTGGAIDNDGYLVVSHSTLRNNSVRNISGGPAVQVGGAIANSGTAQIYESTFSGNHAGAVGGHISNGGAMTITDSSFVGGSANFGAGIANSGSSDLTVDRSYFEDNRAAIGGGAVYNATNGLATVRDSTFSENRAGGDGGAMLNRHGLRVEYSTFAGNVAGGDGDSLASEAGLIGSEANILSGGPSASHCSGTIADFDYNVVHPSRGTCPAPFVVGDPELTAPALRGGSTKTMALGPGSAAFDAAGTIGCTATDQRGVTRPVGARCDAGALENRPPGQPGAPALSGGSTSPNQGTFGLAWSAGTDPDGTPVTYRLRHRAADQASFSQFATPAGPAHTFVSPEAEGTWRYDVVATDGNSDSATSSASGSVVVDRSAPNAPTASADRVPDHVGDVGWYADSVTVSFAGAGDPLLADGSPGSGVAATTAPQTFTTGGEHLATGYATDHAGNTSTEASLTVHVDADAPDVGFSDCPGDVILGSTAQVHWSASDGHSGLSTPTAGTITLDTATVGTRSVTASATDNVGHSATATCTSRVIFDFAGFFRPLANPPTVTDVAGDTVPVSFTLGGNQGLGVFAAGYPQSAPIDCASALELEGGDPTLAKRALSFTKGRNGRYLYLWATDPAWSGSCRQLVVLLVDGTYHRANLRFG